MGPLLVAIGFSSNEQLVDGDYSSRQAGGDGDRDGGLLSEEEGEKPSARDVKSDPSEGGRRKYRVVDFIL